MERKQLKLRAERDRREDELRQFQAQNWRQMRDAARLNKQAVMEQLQVLQVQDGAASGAVAEQGIAKEGSAIQPVRVIAPAVLLADAAGHVVAEPSGGSRPGSRNGGGSDSDAGAEDPDGKEYAAMLQDMAAAYDDEDGGEDESESEEEDANRELLQKGCFMLGGKEVPLLLSLPLLTC